MCEEHLSKIHSCRKNLIPLQLPIISAFAVRKQTSVIPIFISTSDEKVLRDGGRFDKTLFEANEVRTTRCKYRTHFAVGKQTDFF